MGWGKRVKWCHERELNSRPRHYQWRALPLSYRGLLFKGASDGQARYGGLIPPLRLIKRLLNHIFPHVTRENDQNKEESL